MNALAIREHTRSDPVLSKVLRNCELGCYLVCQIVIIPYFHFFRKRSELTIEVGLYSWGFRVVISTRDRKALLVDLHDGYVGSSRLKDLTRNYLW